MFHVKQFAVIVVGGGHAGIEASLACARKGLTTLLLTLDRYKIGEMSCNPSIGGVGKGQLVKEIDALGGEMGRAADFTGIQFKRLNTRKGSAVQSSRCQSDKNRYARWMQKIVSTQANLTVFEMEVKEIFVACGKVKGLRVQDKTGRISDIQAECIIVTTGTFMQGIIHCGNQTSSGGRFGEKSSTGLSRCLADLGFSIIRLKTGTPPRLLRDSIDFDKMNVQLGDVPPRRFSFSDTRIELEQVPCYLTATSSTTHAIIQGNLAKSPLYSGQIKGIGPRYCPSIEDKVVKFPEKPRHQVFLEPESLESDWFYPNGISTSLPPDVQEAFVRTIPGLESVQFARYGYAVEYDCIDPKQLTHALEAKHIQGLFMAGQVNGTSGYEEAAAQGIIAGINAARRAEGRDWFYLTRMQSYIGVLVDDLVSLGVSEPYRMFTSRAEFRLALREDNADIRLHEMGYKEGLICKEDYDRTQMKIKQMGVISAFLNETILKPTQEVDQKLTVLGTSPLTAPQKLIQLLKRPELSYWDIVSLLKDPTTQDVRTDTIESLEIEVKYEGYLAIQRQEIERMKKMSEAFFPMGINFEDVSGLSNEVREKLRLHKPKSLAEAAKIQGVTPAALASLLFYMRKGAQNSGSGEAPFFKN